MSSDTTAAPDKPDQVADEVEEEMDIEGPSLDIGEEGMDEDALLEQTPPRSPVALAATLGPLGRRIGRSTEGTERGPSPSLIPDSTVKDLEAQVEVAANVMAAVEPSVWAQLQDLVATSVPVPLHDIVLPCQTEAMERLRCWICRTYLQRML